MRSHYYWPLLLFICFLVSCGNARHVRKTNERVERKATKKADGNFANISAPEYIERYKNIAIREMQEYGIPASITLAQGLLESGNGNSPLARYANNHFGIKCTPDWKGDKYYKDDDKRNDCFRVYRDAQESFEDHSRFLQRSRYAALFRLRSTDYKGWAHGLKDAGYATNPKYPQLLINLIERFELYQYDEKDNRRNREREDQKQESFSQQGNVYIVRKGDTLFSIAKAYGLTVEEVMRLNNLRSTTIEIGQRINLP
jgi:flagellum-specific peptidoglycan hydrolase FlgJ